MNEPEEPVSGGEKCGGRSGGRSGESCGASGWGRYEVTSADAGRGEGPAPGHSSPGPLLRALAGRRLLHAPLGLWLGFLALAVVSILFPKIDLAVSGLFFTPGEGFLARETPFESLVHSSTGWLLLVVNLSLVTLWFGRQRGWLSRAPLRGRELAYLLLVLALGPGLLVNVLLKDHWGRARPIDCQEFGGPLVFTPAFLPSDQGGRSFSSGHAAGSAYWVVVVLILARSRSRAFWLGLALGYTLLVAWARLAAGGHFLSDILASWFILALLAYGLRGWLFPQAGSIHLGQVSARR